MKNEILTNDEYLEDGYVKLSRLIFKSKTFSSLNAIQKLIAIYLILMANHKDNEWWDSYQKKFVTIKRGSFITSIENIRKKIKDKLVTTKKIRTCIKLLEKMQFLAIERANRYSHITIVKYNLYQNDESYRARQRARQGQDKGKIRATNNNGNNGNNDNNISSSSVETVDNSKISSDIRVCPVEIPVNNLNKKKKPANNIEFDFELWSWHGIDDDIMDRWVKIFPGVEVNLELIKMREFFKTHPGHEKIIKQKFNNNYAIYIFNWLERAMRYKNDNLNYKEGEE